MSGSNVLDAIAHPATVNLLADYQGAAQTAHSIWQNRGDQANALRGQLIQQATGPDGNVDMPTFNRLASQAGPAYAPAAAEGLNQSTEVAGAQQGQALKSMTAMSAMLDSLGPNATHDQVVAGLKEGVNAGWIQPQGAQSVLVGMPDGDDPQSQATRSHILQTVGDRIRSTSERLQSQYGTPQMPDTGGQKVPGAVNPRGGGFTPSGPGVKNTLTPGQKTDTQPALGPDNQPGTQPVGSKYNDDGTLKPAGWGNGGKYPAPGTDPAKPAAPPGFTPTGQSPGQAEAQRGAAEAATAAGTKIYKDASDATDMKSQLLTMESDLGKISTGPQSERSATANAFIQKLTGYGITMSADELASSEGFAKVAKKIALAQAGSLGAGTDEKLTTSLGANPSRDLSKMGNQQIIAMLQGNADAIKARGAAYDQWKQTHPGADTNSFLTDFNKTFDPRIYQWGYQIKNMTPEQRTAAYNALPDKAQFEKNYNAAVKQKLIDPNGY